MLATGLVDRGVLMVMATALIWPAAAALLLALRRRARVAGWVIFLRVGLTAVIVAALFFAWSYALFAGNGDSQAMASLGPQIAALTCLGGAVICALTAVVLRLRR
jgi:membrane associated rhomboid family serine protease